MAENETMDKVIEQGEAEPSESLNTVYARLFLKQSQKIRRDGIKAGIISVLKVIKKLCDADKSDEEIMKDIRGFTDAMMSKSAYGKQHPSLDDYINSK